MIKTEYPYMDNGVPDYTRIKFYSDEGKRLVKKDVPLPFAIESYPSKHDYEEADEDVEEINTKQHSNLC